MVGVTLQVVATDVCDPAPACRIVAVESSEGGTGWTVTGALSLDLRAEEVPSQESSVPIA
jgi:hypothetical protein